MIVYKLILITILISLSVLSGLEFISEHIDDSAVNLILIPYGELFFQARGREKMYDNNVSILIYASEDQIIYQNQISLKFNIQPEELDKLLPVSYNKEYYPVKFMTSLEPGEYQLYIGVTDNSTGRKKDLREVFIFPDAKKRVGFLFFEGKINDFSFILRDGKYFQIQFDTLGIVQHLAFQPDSTRVVVDLDDQERQITIEEIEEVYQVVKDEHHFTIEIANYHEARKYISSPIYPNSAYFYQQKYSPRDQLAQLRYIMNQNEYQYLRSLPEHQLQEAINEYWLSMDPDPYTPENVYQDTFYQRIRYADNNYQIRRYLPGWRTDRGRIYIKYGEPDQIVSDVFPVGREPSITWYYYSLNKVFTFYDLRGYGNYELKDKWLD